MAKQSTVNCVDDDFIVWSLCWNTLPSHGVVRSLCSSTRTIWPKNSPSVKLPLTLSRINLCIRGFGDLQINAIATPDVRGRCDKHHWVSCWPVCSCGKRISGWTPLDNGGLSSTISQNEITQAWAVGARSVRPAEQPAGATITWGQISQRRSRVKITTYLGKVTGRMFDCFTCLVWHTLLCVKVQILPGNLYRMDRSWIILQINKQKIVYAWLGDTFDVFYVSGSKATQNS